MKTNHRVHWHDKHGIVHQEGTWSEHITMRCGAKATYRCVQTKADVDCMACLVKGAT